jgi:hypothetical protein
MAEAICLCRKYFCPWSLGGGPRHPPPTMEVGGVKLLDARGREATRLNRIEQYAATMPPRWRGEERAKATPPFDFAQGREPVERQMMP